MKTKIIKNPEDVKLLQRMEQHMIASNLSKKTISNYLYSVKRTLSFTKKTLNDLNADNVLSWLVYQHENQERGFSTMNITVCSLRYMFGKIMNKSEAIQGVPYPRKNSYLPEILTGEETKSLFEHCNELKYRAVLKLIYGSGLRIGEAVELKANDVDSKQMQVHIRKGKGNKDRFTILSRCALSELREYYRNSQPQEYLFNGYRTGNPINRTSIQRHFRLARNAAGITKDVSVHSLRHCFAAHLLQTGVNIVQIQQYLGHSNIQTTMMYLKMVPGTGTKPISPLDYLYP